MTPRQLIREASAALAASAVPDPEMDAALLLSFITGQLPMNLRLDQWHEVSSADEAAFRALCARRAQRIPLQYLTHRQSFLGRDFYVDERVLIPRPETELLAERAIDALKIAPVSSALDLCCGSGCLGISLALHCPGADVHLSDLSSDALSVAKNNAQVLGARVTPHEGDLFGAIGEGRFGVIVSNPPYIPSEDCRHLQEEVLREPSLALDGGTDGLDLYRRITREAPAHLLPGGTLLMEVGAGQARDVLALCVRAGLLPVGIHEDYQRIERMVEAKAHV